MKIPMSTKATICAALLCYPCYIAVLLGFSAQFNSVAQPPVILAPQLLVIASAEEKLAIPETMPTKHVRENIVPLTRLDFSGEEKEALADVAAESRRIAKNPQILDKKSELIIAEKSSEPKKVVAVESDKAQEKVNGKLQAPDINLTLWPDEISTFNRWVELGYAQVIVNSPSGQRAFVPDKNNAGNWAWATFEKPAADLSKRALDVPVQIEAKARQALKNYDGSAEISWVKLVFTNKFDHQLHQVTAGLPEANVVVSLNGDELDFQIKGSQK